MGWVTLWPVQPTFTIISVYKVRTFLKSDWHLQKKRTALSLAVAEGFLEVVKAILKWDPNLDWVSDDDYGNNLLHLAATKGHVRICEVLHRKNPMLMESVNSSWGGNCTPLLAVLDMIGDHVYEMQDDNLNFREAAEELDSKHAKVVQKLLDLGAKLDCKNTYSTNPLGFVGNFGLPKIGRLITQRLRTRGGKENHHEYYSDGEDSEDEDGEVKKKDPALDIINNKSSSGWVGCQLLIISFQDLDLEQH